MSPSKQDDTPIFRGAGHPCQGERTRNYNGEFAPVLINHPLEVGFEACGMPGEKRYNQRIARFSADPTIGSSVSGVEPVYENHKTEPN